MSSPNDDGIKNSNHGDTENSNGGDTQNSEDLVLVEPVINEERIPPYFHNGPSSDTIPRSIMQRVYIRYNSTEDNSTTVFLQPSEVNRGGRVSSFIEALATSGNFPVESLPFYRWYKRKNKDYNARTTSEFLLIDFYRKACKNLTSLGIDQETLDHIFEILDDHRVLNPGDGVVLPNPRFLPRLFSQVYPFNVVILVSGGRTRSSTIRWCQNGNVDYAIDTRTNSNPVIYLYHYHHGNFFDNSKSLLGFQYPNYYVLLKDVTNEVIPAPQVNSVIFTFPWTHDNFFLGLSDDGDFTSHILSTMNDHINGSRWINLTDEPTVRAITEQVEEVEEEESEEVEAEEEAGDDEEAEAEEETRGEDDDVDEEE